jgi:hypothetical protein
VLDDFRLTDMDIEDILLDSKAAFEEALDMMVQ